MKKSNIRIITSILIIIAGSLITFGIYHFFVRSLDNEISELNNIKNQETTISTRLTTLNNNIEQLDLYDINEIYQKVPDSFDELEIIQFYVQIPSISSGAYIENLTYSYDQEVPIDDFPEEIKAFHITLILECEELGELENFIEQLNTSPRLVYFESINYNLPTENQLMDPNFNYVFTVSLAYDVFYYVESTE